MKNILQYKGYFAKIEYSAEDHLLYGKIEGIRDLVNFESESAQEIEQEFRNAVDDYLALCEELGQEPDKTYSGTFNVRISPALHRAIAIRAMKSGDSLNSTVEKAIDTFLRDDTKYAIQENWNAVSERNYSIQTNSHASSTLSLVKGWNHYRDEYANASF